MRVVVESPLAGDVQTNFRFLLWCLRALWLREKIYGIASHLINPWFMDDSDPEERQAGIDNAWCWDFEDTGPHMRFMDLGESSGMKAAKVRVPCHDYRLAEYHPESWAAFQRGEWPPHTKGFELEGPMLGDALYKVAMEDQKDG